MAYGTVNADVISTSVANTSLGAGNATRFKNRIINGDMRIDQRNAGASVTPTSGQFIVDRWKAYSTQTSKFTVQQNAGSVTPPAGFNNYLGVTSSSSYSVGATDYFLLSQPIEGFNMADFGWGTADAKTVTFSAWVRSSLTGTFGGVFGNNAGNRSYPFSYTISSANTWTQISATIPGDTSGTWLSTNGQGIALYLNLGTGTTYSGTAGAWSGNFYTAPTGATSVVSTNGATFYITGVQLEVGSSATGFEYVDYTTQLAMCQRYYQYGSGLSIYGTMENSSASVRRYASFLPVQMRTSPTVTGTATGGSFNNDSSTQYSFGAYVNVGNSSGSGTINTFTLSAEL